MTSNTNGNQIVPMEKIKDINKLRIAFSKRRIGLFNKANELSIRCGAQIAIIIFSPGDNVFSYSHPSLHGVIDKYFLLNSYGKFANVCHDASNSILQEGDDELAQLEKEMDKEMITRNKHFLDKVSNKDRFLWDVTKSGKMTTEEAGALKLILQSFLNVLKNEKVVMKLSLEPMNGLRPNIDEVPSCFDPFDLVSNGHYQNIEPFDSMGYFLPKESVTNFNFGNINPLIGSSRGTNPFDYTTDGSSNGPFQFIPVTNTGGAGPSGTNIPHGFSPTNNYGFSHGNMRGF